MTREELAAVIDEVLDAPRTVPGRRHTILLAVDHYTATAEAAAFDRGYDTGHSDADDETDFHQEMADRIETVTTQGGVPVTREKRARCGTRSGYNAHLRRGEDCATCRDAQAKAMSRYLASSPEQRSKSVWRQRTRRLARGLAAEQPERFQEILGKVRAENPWPGGDGQ
jgi:hypothetical protein